MRLFKLMIALGLAFLAVAAFYGRAGGPAAPRAAPEIAAAPAPEEPAVTRAETAAPPSALPETVRRLADSPVTGPSRPVVLGEAQPVPVPVAVPVLTQTRGDIRTVTATSANVRRGPSTGEAVVGRVTRGEELEVLGSDGAGWLRVRLQGDGFEGWIAERLVAR